MFGGMNKCPVELPQNKMVDAINSQPKKMSVRVKENWAKLKEELLSKFLTSNPITWESTGIIHR